MSESSSGMENHIICCLVMHVWPSYVLERNSLNFKVWHSPPLSGQLDPGCNGFFHQIVGTAQSKQRQNAPQCQLLQIASRKFAFELKGIWLATVRVIGLIEQALFMLLSYVYTDLWEIVKEGCIPLQPLGLNCSYIAREHWFFKDMFEFSKNNMQTRQTTKKQRTMALWSTLLKLE